AQDSAYTISYGNNLTNKVSFGLNLKYINQEIANFRADAVAFDLGAMCELPVKSLKLGMSLRNIGSSIKFVKEETALPTKTVLSAAFQPAGSVLLISADLNLPLKDQPCINFGAEYNIAKIFSARFGLNSQGGYKGQYKTQKQSNGVGVDNLMLSYGFGLNIKNYSLDYAFIPFGDLGEMQRITLNIKFGGK
ncbi:MAG: hypothetical protein QME68_05855, partial [Elusimicrobiota bacterium]|nr:hypothetical protein [Elusimicrobiota bacterium]